MWRSDGQWVLQQGTREPWEAKDEADAKREAVEMEAFCRATSQDFEDCGDLFPPDLEGPFTYVAKPLRPRS